MRTVISVVCVGLLATAALIAAGCGDGHGHAKACDRCEENTDCLDDVVIIIDGEVLGDRDGDVLLCFDCDPEEGPCTNDGQRRCAPFDDVVECEDGVF